MAAGVTCRARREQQPAGQRFVTAKPRDINTLRAKYSKLILYVDPVLQQSNKSLVSNTLACQIENKPSLPVARKPFTLNTLHTTYSESILCGDPTEPGLAKTFSVNTLRDLSEKKSPAPERLA